MNNLKLLTTTAGGRAVGTHQIKENKHCFDCQMVLASLRREECKFLSQRYGRVWYYNMNDVVWKVEARTW